MINKVSSTCADFWMSDKIVFGEFKENVTIKLSDAKIAVKDRIQASNSAKCPLFLDGRKVKRISKEARDYFSSEEGSELLSAAALIVDSSLTKMLANFFIRINFKKPLIPIKLFSNEQEAIKWLEQYK